MTTAKVMRALDWSRNERFSPGQPAPEAVIEVSGKASAAATPSRSGAFCPIVSMDGSRARIVLAELVAARENDLIRPATPVIRPIELILRSGLGRCVSTLANCHNDPTVLDQPFENEVLLGCVRKKRIEHLPLDDKAILAGFPPPIPIGIVLIMGGTLLRRQRFETHELPQTFLENFEALSQRHPFIGQLISCPSVAFSDGIKQFVGLPRHNSELNAKQSPSVDKPELSGDVASHDVITSISDMLRKRLRSFPNHLSDIEGCGNYPFHIWPQRSAVIFLAVGRDARKRCVPPCFRI
jgi:hypothetical protein